MITLLEKTQNTPVLATETLLSNIQNILSTHQIATPEAKAQAQAEHEEQTQKIKSKLPSNTALMQITGAISAKAHPLEAMCNMTSYESLTTQMKSIVADKSIKRLVLWVDSQGGEAHRCFETSNFIAEQAASAGIEIIAYVEQAASAALAISSIADKIVINPTGSTGSLGVVVSLVDRSKQMEKEGIKPVFITSTNGKVPFDANGSFKPEFIAQLQDDVNYLHGQFVNHVSKYRKLSTSKLNAMQSRMFRAELAIKEGLADEVMTVEEFYSFLNKEVKPKTTPLASYHYTAKAATTPTPEAKAEAPKVEVKVEEVAIEKLHDLKTFAEQRKRELAMTPEQKAAAERLKAKAKLRQRNQ